jgi:hypothetical protein
MTTSEPCRRRTARSCLLFVNKYHVSAVPGGVAPGNDCDDPQRNRGGGLGAGRPISLIETLLKLATAWVIPRVKARMLQHRRPDAPQAPSPAEGWAERGQFFDSGGSGRGCIQAVVTVVSVIRRPHYARPRLCVCGTGRQGGVPECTHGVHGTHLSRHGNGGHRRVGRAKTISAVHRL